MIVLQRQPSNLDRRNFLKVGGLSTIALLGTTGILSFPGAQSLMASSNKKQDSIFNGYGNLQKDPGGILDLPRGFQYRIISEEGGQLSDGRPIPSAFDGMAAFPGKHNSTVLVRNHELTGNTDYPVIGKNPYDKDNTGGTTALVVGPNRKVIDEYVSSSGTIRNCAGGGTPWGTWLTCEETLERGHGYVFEVDPNDPENKRSRTPIREMGAFSHEACDVDPATGIVYLTEDSSPSFLYRFIPVDPSPQPGALQKGGTLQAAAYEEMPNRYAESLYPAKKYNIIWKTINPEKASDDAEAKGCIQFSRLEGSQFSAGVFWFSDTSARSSTGEQGRIYRYIPATNQLELFYEAASANEMEMPDNLCITPWGDVWFVEDGPGNDRVMGITPEGQVYQFAENKLNDSELAGPTFSPDGRTFFVNIQTPGITFAIWGPFARRNAGRQRQMAHAAPPAGLGPSISGEVTAFAEQQGMSDLEVAALERHGIPLL
ncbi:alkaline phosphatase PhoX [Sediminibacillus halophilus]|uniref:alkaline phosphatase PhoX n=1 Tax=Sediminibacillus halophilus TaxID=482461 RepID=UPI0011133EB8|nr:alkaline phosphatase PhoX [Sediminibacillus halophilus]